LSSPFLSITITSVFILLFRSDEKIAQELKTHLKGVDYPMSWTRISDNHGGDAAHIIFSDIFLCAFIGIIAGRRRKVYSGPGLAAGNIAVCDDPGKNRSAGNAMDTDKCGASITWMRHKVRAVILDHTNPQETPVEPGEIVEQDSGTYRT